MLLNLSLISGRKTNLHQHIETGPYLKSDYENMLDSPLNGSLSVKMQPITFPSKKHNFLSPALSSQSCESGNLIKNEPNII